MMCAHLMRMPPGLGAAGPGGARRLVVLLRSSELTRELKSWSPVLSERECVFPRLPIPDMALITAAMPESPEVGAGGGVVARGCGSGKGVAGRRRLHRREKLEESRMG